VYAEQGVKRTAYAEEPGTTLVAIGATPGRAYEPSGWELWTQVAPLYNAQQYDEAADRARELVDAHPEYPAMLYNLACVESLAGRKEDALEHLRQGVARSDRFREMAKEDSDFDAIRDEPAFKELVAG
jgi:tetratricopeptide (TPR) repeat protein